VPGGKQFTIELTVLGTGGRMALALAPGLGNISLPHVRAGAGRDMRKQDIGFDYHRYHRLLSEAVDETKRLELIELLIEEKARDLLAAQRASDRAAMTAMTIAKVLGTERN
jgi:hypothetical protein